MGFKTEYVSTPTPGFVVDADASISMTIDSANIAADSNGKKIIYVGDVLGVAAPFARTKKARIAVKSTLTTALTGVSNDVVFTAKNKYSDNSIKIAYIDPAGNSQPLRLELNRADNTITILLATGAGGAITSTANDIIALVNSHLSTKDMVVASLPTAEVGTGVVTALSATAMTGGYPAFGYALNQVEVTYGDEEVSVLVAGVVDTTVADWEIVDIKRI